MDTVIEGGCLCKAIRYRITGNPLALALCHCRTCRLASGAPSVAWTVFRSSDFVILSGRPNSFSSSPDVVRTFCGRCGTPLTYQKTSQTDTTDVTTASLDRPEDFRPVKEIWVEHRLSWEALNATLPHYSQSSVGASPDSVPTVAPKPPDA